VPCQAGHEEEEEEEGTVGAQGGCGGKVGRDWNWEARGGFGAVEGDSEKFRRGSRRDCGGGSPRDLPRSQCRRRGGRGGPGGAPGCCGGEPWRFLGTSVPAATAAAAAAAAAGGATPAALVSAAAAAAAAGGGGAAAPSAGDVNCHQSGPLLSSRRSQVPSRSYIALVEVQWASAVRAHGSSSGTAATGAAAAVCKCGQREGGREGADGGTPLSVPLSSYSPLPHLLCSPPSSTPSSHSLFPAASAQRPCAALPVASCLLLPQVCPWICDCQSLVGGRGKYRTSRSRFGTKP